MNPNIIDHQSGKVYPVNVQPRLNCKIVNTRPTPTPSTTANASWYEILLALLCVFLVSVAIALKVNS